MDDKITRAAKLLSAARKIVILTGAGVSKESGVPTFRDALDGLWARYDPQQLATRSAFQADPKLVWDWYEYRRDLVRKAAPNPGHFALAQLESKLPNIPITIITQNVDDLHEQAGSTDIVHLHGNIARNKCFDDCQGSPTLIDISKIEWDKTGGPPPCPYCGGWVRPDVVWFGEMLPPDALERAAQLSIACDVMLVIGTTGLVTPAGDLPHHARRAGAQIIEINPTDSAITPIAHIKLDGPSGEIMPRVLEAFSDV